MADNIKYRFIQNVGDYFPSGYFSEDFIDKVQKASGLTADGMAALCQPYAQLRREYEAYKNYIVNTNPRVKDAIRHTHDFNSRLLRILGYDATEQYCFYGLDEASQAAGRASPCSSWRCSTSFPWETANHRDSLSNDITKTATSRPRADSNITPGSGARSSPCRKTRAYRPP